MFGSSAHHRGATLLVSVGAANISLGIVEYQKDSLVLRLSMSASLSAEERGEAQAATGLKNLLKDKVPALLRVYAGTPGHKTIHDVFAIVHAPISRSQIVTNIRLFGTEEKITDALLDECARSALGDIAKRPDFLGARLLQVRLDGYATARSEGKHAIEVEVIGLACELDHAFKDPILSAIQAALPGVPVNFRSGVLAIASIESAHDVDCVIFLLSTEGTEIVVMRRGVPTTCAFVPIGMRSIAERASKGTSPETLLSTLRIVRSGKGSDTALQEAEAALGAIEPEVAKVFGESLALLSNPFRIPVRALLVCPSEMTEWFGRFLARIDFAPFTLTAQPFEIAPVVLPDLGMRQKEKDPDLILATLLLKSEHAS